MEEKLVGWQDTQCVPHIAAPDPSPGWAGPPSGSNRPEAEAAKGGAGRRSLRGNPIMRFRAGARLEDAIATAHKAAGDPTTSDTIRRLVARGLELGPALSDRERETIEELRRQLTYLGNNLNQLVRQSYMRDVGRGFDWPALETLTGDLEQVRQRLTKALQDRL